MTLELAERANFDLFAKRSDDDEEDVINSRPASRNFLESPLISEQFTFKECVPKIKEVYIANYNAFDSLTKLESIDRYLTRYFSSEDVEDLFEGFLHMMVEMRKFTRDYLQRSENILPKQVFDSFKRYLSTLDDEKRDLIIKPKPEKTDLLVESLVLLSSFKVKHLAAIESLFLLKNKEMSEVLLKTIWEIMKTGEYSKAIHWMAHFDTRDNFPFEYIVAKLFVDNQNTMLMPFIGDDLSRKKKLVRYLDHLVGLHLKVARSCGEFADLENVLIQDYRRLEKAITKYLNEFDFPSSYAPNAMNCRCRDALMHQHFLLIEGKTSPTNFESIAMHAMTENKYVCDWYLSFLCKQANHREAIKFSMLLGMSIEMCNEELKRYSYINSHVYQEVRDEVIRKKQRAKDNDEIDRRKKCRLKLTGTLQNEDVMINVVDNWSDLQALTTLLPKHELIGIDAEWRPHFTTHKELVALIQVSTQTDVYLVDVVELENSGLSDDKWIEFFEALLCTEKLRKIGYDITNDIRVLKSTFKFMSELIPRIKNLVCLYKLFKQVVIDTEACKAAFDSQPPANLGLSDVTNFFVKINLSKTERIGNWSQRPLRYEQKQYAALDAYCLIRIFEQAGKRLLTINDQLKIEALADHALIKFEESKPKPVVYPMTSGSTKEDDEEFFLNIYEVSEKIRTESDSKKEILTADDVGFAVDSMLFGLGKYLRKCGFDTRLIQDRLQLIIFCQNNKNFVALSTGKGYKQINQAAPGQALDVPDATQSVPSNLVKYIMNKLNIAISPTDMVSRCVDCNMKSFIRVPKAVIEALFHHYLIQHDCDWIEITEEESEQILVNFRKNSCATWDSTEVVDKPAYAREQFRSTLSDEDYILLIGENSVVCECKNCSIDFLGRLILPDTRGSPTQMNIGLRLKKELFENHSVNFYVCIDCGKIEWSKPSTCISTAGTEF